MRFIRKRLRAVIAYISCMLIFAVCLLLNEIPFSDIVYPITLCTFLGLGFLAAGLMRYKARCRELDRIANGSMDVLGDLPPSIDVYEEEYQKIITLLMDEKERKEQELHSSYADMVDYYSTWAHQIKTPIAAMKLRLQNEDSELSRALRNELADIERYVDMVMTYLRLDSNDSDFVIRELSIDDVLKPVIRSFSSSFISKGISLSYTPSGLTVISDEKWLSIVLEQVISNAVKYTPSGTISIYSDRNRLFIKDTGIGIAPEDLPRIFEKGYTGFNGRRFKVSSGIGLYLCRRICDMLGHSIAVQSSPGNGTIIMLDFGDERLDIE